MKVASSTVLLILTARRADRQAGGDGPIQSMTVEEKIIRNRVGLFQPAKELVGKAK
jgi:hypothetical protein